MRTSLIILVILFVQDTYGQSIKFTGVKAHYGSILPHSKELVPISKSNPFGFQADISWLKISDEAWQTCNCYGRTGVSFAYFNYANPSQLGSSYNFVYFAEPYLTFRRRLKLSLRSGVGITYLNKVHNEQTNPENLFYSAPVSFYLQLALNLNYHVGQDFAINLSANYNHISNGGQKQPNKGINFPTISVGLDRVVGLKPLVPKPEELRTYNSGRKFYLGLFGNMRSSDEAIKSSNHPRIGVVGGFMKSLSRVNGLSAALELGYDDSYQFNIEERDLEESPVVSALLAGHHFNFGRVYFLTHFGVHLLRPRTLQPKRFFQNYSLFYRFSERFALGTSLIANGHVADHMDLRLIWMSD